MLKEAGEVIGFLLARLEERDGRITQLQQQIEAGKQAASQPLTEHPSTPALAGRSQENKHGSRSNPESQSSAT